nr:immunoglobulin light chain junction region [Macaca mulatta]MPN88199.1 immunoglobulin light chain junction region [Macaca mulatta]MPN88222.1 immunoglobulin light chain junction region [Macaca mulatta]MPN90225.1 immunoglobulin light chain junction region [Macaca mulatta]MPN90733.1 immunoglobulin light chain junction region [Macaca mulatta]
CMQGIQFPLAF